MSLGTSRDPVSFRIMSEHEQELAESTDTLIPPPTGPDTMESGDHADPDVIEVRLKTLEDREATVMISKHVRTLYHEIKVYNFFSVH